MAQTYIAEDATVTLTGGGADDGSYTGSGTTYTLRFRKVKANFKNNLVDVTAANDVYKKYRAGHRDFTLTLEGLAHNTNTGFGDMGAVAWASMLCKVTMVPYSGAPTMTIYGIVEEFNLDVDEPDVETLTIRPAEGPTAPTWA